MKRFACLILALVLAAGSARALDERLLVLPPTQTGLDTPAPTASRWTRLVEIYSTAVWKTRPVPTYDAVKGWAGDTVLVDFYDIDAAIQWAQQLDADAALLSEWHPGPEGVPVVRLQRVDPWSGEVRGPVEAETSVAAVQKLEAANWIFGTPVASLPDGYNAPAPTDGSRAVHTWVHRHDLAPPDAVIQGMVGYATVQVVVSAQGVPLKVDVGSVRPAGLGFSAVFEKALWAIPYTPAKLKGTPVIGIYRATLRIDPVP